MNRALRTTTAFVGTFGSGLIAMIFVNAGVGSWYASLVKPAFSPPEIFFPLAWTTLYVLMAIACMHVWRITPQNSHTEGWVRFYFIQLILNAGWTIFFFGFHTVTVAFIDTLVICFFAVGLTASAWEIDRRVTFLMLPYTLWLFFALYLTAGIWLLN